MKTLQKFASVHARSNHLSQERHLVDRSTYKTRRSAERGIDLCHETVRFWWNRFGPMFATDIRRQRVSRMRAWSPRWNGITESCITDSDNPGQPIDFQFAATSTYQPARTYGVDLTFEF